MPSLQKENLETIIPEENHVKAPVTETAIKNESSPNPENQAPAANKTLTPATPSSTKTAPPPPKETKAPSYKIKSSKIAPIIKTDFSDLITEIEKEEKALLDIENPYTQEHVYAVFVRWKENSKSNSFKAAIDYSKIKVHEDNKITIYTPAEIYIDMLKQEMAMIEEIHMMYPSRDIIFEFVVNKSAFPNYTPPKKVKLMNTMEKYDLLKQKNPDFELFVKELKLKPK